MQILVNLGLNTDRKVCIISANHSWLGGLCCFFVHVLDLPRLYKNRSLVKHELLGNAVPKMIRSKALENTWNSAI